jgi:hypothetical protein
MGEESDVDSLAEEVVDLRRQVNQQGSCLGFLWIVVVLLSFLTFFQFDLALVFISVVIIIALGAYILEKRGL